MVKFNKLKEIDRILVAKLLLIGALVLLILSLGTIGYHWLNRGTSIVPTSSIHTLPAITASDDGPLVVGIAHKYINAFIQGQYDVMWSMLHPQIQATWSDEQSFARYWKLRFHDYTLRSASFGNANDRSYWINPETMVRYDEVESLPVSLQLDPNLPKNQLLQLAPQFQYPDQIFQNLPFIVQKQSGQSDQWLVLSGGPADPEAPLLPPMTPINTMIKVPILMYHYISAVPINDPSPILRASLSVAPALFSQQLDYLKAKGYHSITLNQLMNALYYEGPLPINPIIFTFDDGYLDAYQDAYPALKAHGFSGMFYIITGKVGWIGQASWRQLQEMLNNGMQIGSHTVTHNGIGQVYQASPSQATVELQLSQEDLQKHLGVIIQHFCYPNGDPFKGHNLLLQQRIVALLASLGYIDATTDPGPTGVLQHASESFVLLRLRVDGRASLQFFMNMLLSYTHQ